MDRIRAARPTRTGARFGALLCLVLRPRLLVVLVLPLGCSVAGVLPVAAATPSWMSQITPLERRADAELRRLSLIYEVSWSKWLQAGTLSVDFDPERRSVEPAVDAAARAKSNGPVRVFWPFESTTRSKILGRSLYPDRFQHSQRERGEKETFEATYRNGHMTVESVSIPSGGGQAERDQRTYDLAQIRDLLSALLYLQQTKLTQGREITLLVQPLDRLYLVTLNVVGSEQRALSNRTWKTKRLEVKIRKITEDFELTPYTKMRRATLWLSDDAYQVPVEIQADLRVGFVAVRLAGLN